MPFSTIFRFIRTVASAWYGVRLTPIFDVPSMTHARTIGVSWLSHAYIYIWCTRRYGAQVKGILEPILIIASFRFVISHGCLSMIWCAFDSKLRSAFIENPLTQIGVYACVCVCVEFRTLICGAPGDVGHVSAILECTPPLLISHKLI